MKLQESNSFNTLLLISNNSHDRIPLQILLKKFVAKSLSQLIENQIKKSTILTNLYQNKSCSLHNYLFSKIAQHSEQIVEVLDEFTLSEMQKQHNKIKEILNEIMNRLKEGINKMKNEETKENEYFWSLTVENQYFLRINDDLHGYFEANALTFSHANRGLIQILFETNDQKERMFVGQSHDLVGERHSGLRDGSKSIGVSIYKLGASEYSILEGQWQKSMLENGIQAYLLHEDMPCLIVGQFEDFALKKGIILTRNNQQPSTSYSKQKI